MESRIRYHEEHNIIEVICTGEANLQGFKDYTQSLSTNEHLGAKARFLFDHRELLGNNLTLSTVKEIAKYLKSFSGKMKHFKQAIVVSPHADVGKTQIFKVLIDDLAKKDLLLTRIFTDYDAAYKWLTSKVYIEL